MFFPKYCKSSPQSKEILKNYDTDLYLFLTSFPNNHTKQTFLSETHLHLTQTGHLDKIIPFFLHYGPDTAGFSVGNCSPFNVLETLYSFRCNLTILPYNILPLNIFFVL